MAIKLREDGITDFEILEMAASIGLKGTVWTSGRASWYLDTKSILPMSLHV